MTLIAAVGCGVAASEKQPVQQGPVEASGKVELISVTPIPISHIVVRDYNLAAPVERYSDLSFPKEACAHQVGDTVVFSYEKTGVPAFFLEKLQLDAAQISSLNVMLDATLGEHKESSVELKTLRLYWARAEDVAGQGAWPFSEERAVNLTRSDAATNEWVADLSGHDFWTATVDRMFFSIHFDTSEGINVYLKRIEFLTDRYDGSAVE